MTKDQTKDQIITELRQVNNQLAQKIEELLNPPERALSPREEMVAKVDHCSDMIVRLTVEISHLSQRMSICRDELEQHKYILSCTTDRLKNY